MKTLLGRRTVPSQKEGTDDDIRRKFADVFAGVGKLKNYQLKFHVDKTVQPIAQPVRRLPFGVREREREREEREREREKRKNLDELLEKEIIEEVSKAPTTWLSPHCTKPDGDTRIWLMRRADEAIVRDIPTIEEVLQHLSGSTGVQQARSQMGISSSGAGRGVTGNNYIRDTPRIVQVSQANVWALPQHLRTIRRS